MCRLRVNWHICSHLVPQNETCQFDGLPEHKRGESTAVLVDTPCWLCEQSPSEFINAMVTTQLTARDVISALGISENHPDLMALIGNYFDRYENGHLAGMRLGFYRLPGGLDMPRPEVQNQNVNAQLSGIPASVGINNAFPSARIQGFPQLRSLGQSGLVTGNQNNMDIASSLSVGGAEITSGHNAQLMDDYSSYQSDIVDPADTTKTTTNAELLGLDEVLPTLDDHHSLIALEHLQSVQAHREMNMTDSGTSDSDGSIGVPSLENTVRQSVPDNAEMETENSVIRQIWRDKESLQSSIPYPLHSQNAQINALTPAEHREFSSSNLHHLTVIAALNHQLETQGPSYDLVQALSKEVSECAHKMQAIGERWHQLSDTVMRNINRYNVLQAPEMNANGTLISHDDDELLRIASIP
ncbi:hypothetical protein NFIA_008720 [Paecilomyces variotii No. 5]|uniref:Uncharacterized protein n=1 Tax=Byssochlamys spectabilis (strain No. 5 / NBRC 109023) TaxID=1356009 RepID=V5I3H5_BYSSN|nr:hypothetical protein NFIA_008720 [Paecilomyces variotii No. 5]